MYTRDLKGGCEKVVERSKQCQLSIPKNHKAEGLLKEWPILPILFHKETAKVFKLGHVQGECLYRKKPIHGIFLIQDRHSGYIQILPCTTKNLT